MAVKLPQQIPTLNLKLLYHSLDSELTIYAKARLQKNFLPLQFLHCFILDVWRGWCQTKGRMKFGEAKQTLQLPASVISLGVKATCLGLQVLCAMTRQNITPKYQSMTRQSISEKGVSEIWGFCLSSSLHKNWPGNPVQVIYTCLVHFLTYKAIKDHAPFQLLEVKIYSK